MINDILPYDITTAFILFWFFMAGAMVQWLKLSVWKVEDRGFEPQSGLQI